MPFMFIADPGLMMQGSPGSILLSVITAIAGVWAVGAGIMGYFVVPLAPGLRVLALATGSALFATHFHLPGENLLLAGGIVGIAVLSFLVRRSKPQAEQVRS